MGKYRKNLSSSDEQQLVIAEEVLEKIYSEHNKNGNGNGNGHKKPLGFYGLEGIPIKIKCLNEKQKTLKNAIETKDLIISTGPAGTGKTYVTLISALSLMKKDPKYRKLYLVKSIQTIPGENLGTLPGTVEEKIEPHYYSFSGNLDKIFKFKSLKNDLIKQDIIEFTPIAFLRGVTIDDGIVIIDEIQNLSVHAFRTIVTRMGNNCKMIFLGDSDQIDLKNPNESCINKILKVFRNSQISEIVEFEEDETVRNPLIKEILNLMKGI